ncbi:MAG: type II secretion system protein J [Rubripirellula sp.]
MNQRTSRSAFTLVELLVTMTAGSAMMILAIGMVHQAMSINSMSRQQADQARARSRLGTDFRQDVHLAKNSIVESDQRVTLVRVDETRVTYIADGNQVTREQVLSEDQTRREGYSFSDESTVMFKSLGSPNRTVLTILRTIPVSSKHSETRIDCQVAPVVGRRLMCEVGESSP